ncbi:MAG: hypothetical protein JWP36_2930 [Paucimonas sp.]|nr:hypothetical protein [Paucimonas sp.]
MNTTPDSDRHAYNAAFYELGLRWCWDEDTWRDLTSIGCEDSRIKTYLQQHQAHLLTAYEPDFLVRLIRDAKARCQETLGGSAAHAIDWKAFQGTQVGV